MAEIRDSLVNTLVGAGSALEGDLDVDGMIRVDGDLRGSIRATGRVVVGATGRIDASIRAQSVIVGGIVRGDLYVTDRARLLSGAVVLGNIFAPRFEAEDGATIHGAVEVTGRSTGAEGELKRFVERHGDPLRFLGPFRGDASLGASRREDPADDDGSGDSRADRF
ncbi:MAG: polymer-forming cytoskeletal protein [Spirochaetota bacterium]